MSITLPPINIGTAVIPSTAGLRLVADIDIRARDIAVAKCVLEAAANACDMPGPWHHYATASEAQQAIRALEVSHD